MAQANNGPAGSGPVAVGTPPPPMGKVGSLTVSEMTYSVSVLTANVRSMLPPSGNPHGAGVPFADLTGPGNVTTHSVNPGLGSQAPPLLGMGKGQKGGKGYPTEYGMYGYGYRDMSHLLTQTMSDVLPISAWDGNLDVWDDWYSRWRTHSSVVFKHASEETLMFLL